MRKIRFLPNDDDANGWTRTLPARAAKPPLEGEVRADWIVVGAGFAGLAAARRLAENRPNDKVVLVEAQCVGDGASGRNSGFVIDLPHNVGAADLANLESSRRALRLSRAALAYLEENVTRHGIDCRWSRRGQYQVAASAEGERALGPFVKELDALGEPYRYLDRGETARELGTEYYRASVHTPGTVLLQPAALVRGLADSLPANVTLFERTPVTEIDYGARVTVRTPKGSVEAPAIILGVNGFAPEFGHYRRRVFVCRAFASLTRPLTPAERQALGGVDDWGLVPTNAFAGATMRLTQDRRLLFRQNIAFTNSFYTDPSRHEVIRRSHEPLFRARFPMLPEVTFEHTWVGYVCLSRNFAPGFGRHAPNVYTAVCQNAVGATKGTVSGMLAADLATGEDNPLIADMEKLGQPEPLPPRPFLDIGAWASVAWWTWRGRAER